MSQSKVRISRYCFSYLFHQLCLSTLALLPRWVFRSPDLIIPRLSKGFPMSALPIYIRSDICRGRLRFITLSCKANKQYLLSWKVVRYCILALMDSTQPATFSVDPTEAFHTGVFFFSRLFSIDFHCWFARILTRLIGQPLWVFSPLPFITLMDFHLVRYTTASSHPSKHETFV